MNTTETKTLINGELLAAINVTDRGLQFGDGVFETIRVEQGKPVWWQQHVDRLLKGCQRLHFLNLPDAELLKNEVNELLTTDYDTGTLKIIITRGNSTSGYAIPAECIPNRVITLSSGPRHESKAEQGIVLGVCKQQISGTHQLAGIKHLNRLEQVLARTECQDKGWDEGLMLDDRHRVIEGCMSNIFVWQQGTLMTPKLEHAGVRGVCRDKVLLLAKEIGMNVRESEIDLGDLLYSDGMFVTNSLIGIWPVKQFRCRHIKERQFDVNENTRLLQDKLEADICSVG